MTALGKTAVLAACFGWSVATFPAAAQDAGEITNIAEEAYIFAYPLLYNYKTLYTQTQEAEFPGYIGGFERYRHYSRPVFAAGHRHRHAEQRHYLFLGLARPAARAGRLRDA